MFSEATRTIKPHYEYLGWKNEASGVERWLGVGVFVSKNVFLTVNHVIDGYENRGFLLFQEGYVRDSSVIFSDKEHDFAILVAGDSQKKVADTESKDTNDFPYPLVERIFPQQGTSVGYLSRFSRPRSGNGDSSYTMFTASHISFHLYDEPGKFIALCPAFAEPGFSGSPVFTTQRQLVGLISQGYEFTRRSQMLDVTNVPIVASIYPHIDRILDAIKTKG